MSSLGFDARRLPERIQDWLRYRRWSLRRSSAGAVLARSIAVTCGIVGAVVVVPVELISLGDPRVAAIVVPAAVGVGLLPRTRWVTLYALAVVLVWLFTTLVLSEPVAVWRVGLLTAALYVMHTSATLAAVLPYDAVMAPGVLWAWARRTGAVLGAGLGTGLGGMALAGALPQASSWAGPVAGALIAAGLAGVLAWHLLRR